MQEDNTKKEGKGKGIKEEESEREEWRVCLYCLWNWSVINRSACRRRERHMKYTMITI